MIADSSKRVDRLGVHPLPVEVVPFAAPWVADQIENLGGKALLMKGKSPEEPYLTDQRNQILECWFTEIEDPRALGQQIENIPGVVGHGLFVGYAHAALVAQGGDVWILRRGQAPALFTGSAPPAKS